jgi:uncharacterized protein (DUF58 family)
MRGRAFAAAGGTIVVCAFVLGQGTLVRIGVLVLVLPGLAWVAVRLRRPHVGAARLVARPVVAAGAACEVELVVSAAHTGTLLVEDELPYALGPHPRFVLEGGGEHRLAYTVRSDVRGKFTLGPLTTRTTDPFGLTEMRQVVPGTAWVTVTPRTTPLPAINLGGGRAGAGERQVPTVAAGSAEDVTVREYRRGDDLRRVHWRSSARVGELMVRREEHPWEARATVLLDNRARAHAGHGAGGSLETAVTIAASVAVHLDARGYAVRLATADGLVEGGTEQVSALLEHLALVGLRPRGGIDTSWTGESGRDGTVIGVFGALAPDDLAAARRLRHGAAVASAFVLDVGQWHRRIAGEAADLASARLLRDLGWRTAGVGRRTAVDQAWRDLALRAEARR